MVKRTALICLSTSSRDKTQGFQPCSYEVSPAIQKSFAKLVVIPHNEVCVSAESRHSAIDDSIYFVYFEEKIEDMNYSRQRKFYCTCKSDLCY